MHGAHGQGRMVSRVGEQFPKNHQKPLENKQILHFRRSGGPLPRANGFPGGRTRSKKYEKTIEKQREINISRGPCMGPWPRANGFPGGLMPRNWRKRGVRAYPWRTHMSGDPEQLEPFNGRSVIDVLDKMIDYECPPLEKELA